MPMHLTASPATFDGNVMTVELLGPHEITKRVQPATMAEAKAELESFVAALTPGDWAVTAFWIGRDKAPRGFKAAADRDEFTRRIRAAVLA